MTPYLCPIMKYDAELPRSVDHEVLIVIHLRLKLHFRPFIYPNLGMPLTHRLPTSEILPRLPSSSETVNLTLRTITMSLKTIYVTRHGVSPPNIFHTRISLAQ